MIGPAATTTLSSPARSRACLPYRSAGIVANMTASTVAQ
jgi:hypothetical protein